MLNRDQAKRPTVNTILSTPIMQSRIKGFLSTTMIGTEFSHTIIHNKNLWKINEEVQAKEKQAEQFSNARPQDINNLPGLIPPKAKAVDDNFNRVDLMGGIGKPK